MEMKQAVLIQCHKKPKQVNLLLNALNDPDLEFFIHVDKKKYISTRNQKRKTNPHFTR